MVVDDTDRVKGSPGYFFEFHDQAGRLIGVPEKGDPFSRVCLNPVKQSSAKRFQGANAFSIDYQTFMDHPIFLNKLTI
jgi:hypothetical protein